MKIEVSTYGLYNRITVGASQEIMTKGEWSKLISQEPTEFEIPQEVNEIEQLSFPFHEYQQ